MLRGEGVSPPVLFWTDVVLNEKKKRCGYGVLNATTSARRMNCVGMGDGVGVMMTL
jgi:hypothetical protein